MLLSWSSSFIFVGWNSTREWMPHATALGRPQWKKALVHLCSTQKNKNLEVAKFQSIYSEHTNHTKTPWLGKSQRRGKRDCNRGTAKERMRAGEQLEGENGKRVVGPGFMLRSPLTAEELCQLLYTSDFEWTVKEGIFYIIVLYLLIPKLLRPHLRLSEFLKC